MRIAIDILGTEVFAIELGPIRPESKGDCTTTSVGFTARVDVPRDVDIPDRS